MPIFCPNDHDDDAMIDDDGDAMIDDDDDDNAVLRG